MDLFVVIIMGLLGLWITISNWRGVFRYYKYKKSTTSIPLFGGLFIAIAFVFIPNNPVSYVWWLAFLIDYGSLPLLLQTICFFVKKK